MSSNGSPPPAPPGAGTLPKGCALESLSIELTHVGDGAARARMPVGLEHTNQVGVVQGGIYVVFADATAGWAAVSALPRGKGFTTVEMRANVLRATRPGDVLIADATPVHLGGTTMVFEVRVHVEETKKQCAFFVCTQLVFTSERT